MFVFVSGAVRSGKSLWAEECAARLTGQEKLPEKSSSGTAIYLATARIPDREMRERVARHRRERAKKGFLTVERARDLQDIVPQIPANATVLLECLGTWTANELFDGNGRICDGETAFEKIRAAVDEILVRASNLIIVSNELFSDGILYGGSVESYRRLLGRLHVRLASCADLAAEVAAGRLTVYRDRGGFLKAEIGDGAV